MKFDELEAGMIISIYGELYLILRYIVDSNNQEYWEAGVLYSKYPKNRLFDRSEMKYGYVFSVDEMVTI